MEFSHVWICVLTYVILASLQVYGQDVSGPFVNLSSRASGLCPQGRYGEICEYECHCPVGTECDPLSGQCPDGCAAGWSGPPYCQSQNVALGKSTYQHGTYLGWNSSRAVDGNPDQDGSYGACAWAHNSDDVFKTWWNVDLGRTFTVQSIEIYFRTDDAMSQSRRAGIRIYISNSQEEAKNEGLCYMDQMSDFDFPPSHLTLRDGSLTCTQRHGRYIIVYVDRPTQTPIRNCPSHTLYSCWANLELCEVEVYACSNGTFGDKCQHRCHCEGVVGCHATSGACPGRCQAGWEGPSCNNKCRPGTYGSNCGNQCGHCAGSGVRDCDRVTGQCPACLPGWTGSLCKDACPAGRYGANCESVCGNCMGTCDPQTGICSLGCKAGWVGAMCTDQCAPGKYGPECESLCANCKGGKPCDHVTGYCDVGCAVGFTGKRCDKGCDAGFFGEECNNTCGHCRDNLNCDHVTGTCPSGCEPGWTGALCKKECPWGNYGNQCSGECGVCSGNQTCHHVSGICTNGCGDGWTDQKCKNKCLLGQYGPGCTGVCGSCKNGNTCNYVTGSCDKGCSEGWTGPECQQACESGAYGQDCRSTCGFCRNRTACDHVTGVCTGGCDGDYYGELCVLSMKVAGKDKSDATSIAGQDPEMSVLIGGVVAGVFVVFVGILMFVLIRRKKGGEQHKADRRSIHGNGSTGQENGHINHASTANQSPTPSRASSMATVKTNCTQSFITIDDQEVLYVNLKKKQTPRSMPIPVPSPKLSSFQRKVVPTTSDGDVGSPEEPTYYNTIERLPRQTGTDLSIVEQFAQHLREMDIDKNSYKTEFAQYAAGLKYPHEAGKRPRNKFKNRFARMFPYDHSRVVLEEDPAEPDSDYINANYIDSVDYPNCYIATQGPNQSTVKDFWRMVWQNKCGKIVMLTNLIEESKNKCELYWPEDRGVVTFGNIKIRLSACQEYPFYIVRFFTFSNDQFPDDVRTIKHFHFTAWPDHGVPDTFEIVAFFKCVLRTSTTLPGPMIVHCSAGVGRSGTFISLDAMYHYAKRGGVVDIPSFVHKMRQQRMNMIQTIEQYRLLHYALFEALECGDTAISGSTFHSECLRQVELYNEGMKNRIAEEFQRLEDLKPKLGNECFLAALRKENVEKNRSLNVLAADKYRPYLSTYVPDTTDYINAIVVPSRSNKRGYIVTQLPLKNTVVDFWRLIYDHASNVIVQLNALDEDQEESCAWWPSQGDTITFGPLVVETLAVETPCREVTERTFRIVRKGIKESKLVYMITYNDWRPDKYLPCTIDSFLVVIQRTDLYRKSFPDASITVLCLDGVVSSGLFLATCNAIDQLSRDHEVDIFNTVRQIQMRRPQFIKNKDQYLFIYQSVCRSIETVDTGHYGNL